MPPGGMGAGEDPSPPSAQPRCPGPDTEDTRRNRTLGEPTRSTHPLVTSEAGTLTLEACQMDRGRRRKPPGQEQMIDHVPSRTCPLLIENTWGPGHSRLRHVLIHVFNT